MADTLTAFDTLKYNLSGLTSEADKNSDVGRSFFMAEYQEWWNRYHQEAKST